MNTAYLVFGPEGSGTRYVTSILIQAGCEGDHSHFQRWDRSPIRHEGIIVWRRSFPHGFKWPDIDLMVNRLRPRPIVGVVCTRDMWCVSRSHMKIHHATDAEDSLGHQRTAYKMILEGFWRHEIPWVFAVYEALVARPDKAPKKLCKLLGLKLEKTPETRDGDEKYYARENA
jgi:hypothetical protein